MRPNKRPNHRVSKTFHFFLFTASVVSLFGCSGANHPELIDVRSFFYDWKSKSQIQKKENEAAHDSVLKALENEPDSFNLQSNLGITFDGIEKKEDAEKSLLSALSLAKTDADKFKIQFNLGVLLGGQKKIEPALEHYQAALEILPTSKETKHNIELLIQQQQQDQKQKQSDQQKKDQQQGGGGQDDQQKKDQDQKNKDNKDQNKDPKNDQQNDQKNESKEQKDQDRKNSPKYKPRPYQGEQLSEGDVKKILGELSQQDKKIRSNFNKKEQQRKEDRNGKDW